MVVILLHVEGKMNVIYFIEKVHNSVEQNKK